MQTTPYLLIALLIGLTTSSCSLVVNDLTPGRCLRFDECKPLNERDGLDALSCELWTCDVDSTMCVRRPRDLDGDRAFGPYPAGAACTYPVTDCDDDDPTRSPGKTEVCDGIDNDCDLAIDETTDGRHPFAHDGPSAGPFPMGDGNEPSSIAFPSAQEPSAREAIVATRQGGVVVGNRVTLGTSATTSLAWQSWCGDPTPTMNCVAAAPPLPPRSNCGVSLTCGFGSPALDRAGTAVWIASASDVFCPTSGGDVRVGALSSDKAFLDANGEAIAGVPACGAGGARRPALATLVGPAAQQLALVAHLAEALTSTRACGGGAVAVRARVVRLSNAGTGRVDFVAGAPMLDLGSTNATSAPAVVSIAPAGWVVAFGAAAGGAELHWIPADGATSTKVGSIGTGPTGEVRISAGTGTSTITVGVARQAGCDSGPIVYQTIRFAPNDPAGTFATSAEIMLAPSGRAPSLVHVESGLVMTGFARSLTPPITGPIATAEQTGGWIVMWSDAAPAGDAWTSRILALDDAEFGEHDRIANAAGDTNWIARAAMGAGAPLVDAFIFGDQTLRSAALYCTPR